MDTIQFSDSSTFSPQQLDTRDLVELRLMIDSIDVGIVKLLGSRFDVCRRIALAKQMAGLPVNQPHRAAQVKQRCISLGEQYHVSPRLISVLYDLIIAECCLFEHSIVGEDSPQ